MKRYKCANCGSDTGSLSRFCEKCGKRLEDSGIDFDFDKVVKTDRGVKVFEGGRSYELKDKEASKLTDGETIFNYINEEGANYKERLSKLFREVYYEK